MTERENLETKLNQKKQQKPDPYDALNKSNVEKYEKNNVPSEEIKNEEHKKILPTEPLAIESQEAYLKKKILELQQKIEDLKTLEKMSKKSYENKLEEVKNSYEQKIKKLLNKFEAMNRKNSEIELSAKNIEVKSLNQEIATFQKEVERLKKRIEEQNVELEQNNKKPELIIEGTHNFTQNKDNKRTQRDIQETLRVEQDKTPKKLSIGDNNGQLLQQSSDNSIETVENYLDSVEKMTLIRDLQEQIEEQNQKIQGLKNQKDEQQEQIKTLREDNQKSQEQYNELQQTQEKIKKEQAINETKLVDLEKQLNETREKNQQQQAEIKGLKEKLEKRDQQIQGLEKQEQFLEGGVKELQEKLDFSEKNLENVENHYEKLLSDQNQKIENLERQNQKQKPHQTQELTQDQVNEQIKNIFQNIPKDNKNKNPNVPNNSKDFVPFELLDKYMQGKTNGQLTRELIDIINIAKISDANNKDLIKKPNVDNPVTIPELLVEYIKQNPVQGKFYASGVAFNCAEQMLRVLIVEKERPGSRIPQPNNIQKKQLKQAVGYNTQIDQKSLSDKDLKLKNLHDMIDGLDKNIQLPKPGKVGELSRQIEELKKQNQKQQEQLIQKNQQIQGLTGQLENLQNERISIKSQLEQLEKENNELKELQEKYNALGEQFNKVKNDLKKEQENYKALDGQALEFFRQVKQVEKLIYYAEEENKDLKDYIEIVEKGLEVKENHNVELSHENQELKEKLEKIQKIQEEQERFLKDKQRVTNLQEPKPRGVPKTPSKISSIKNIFNNPSNQTEPELTEQEIKIFNQKKNDSKDRIEDANKFHRKKQYKPEIPNNIKNVINEIIQKKQVAESQRNNQQKTSKQEKGVEEFYNNLKNQAIINQENEQPPTKKQSGAKKKKLKKRKESSKKDKNPTRIEEITIDLNNVENNKNYMERLQSAFEKQTLSLKSYFEVQIKRLDQGDINEEISRKTLPQLRRVQNQYLKKLTTAKNQQIFQAEELYRGDKKPKIESLKKQERLINGFLRGQFKALSVLITKWNKQKDNTFELNSLNIIPKEEVNQQKNKVGKKNTSKKHDTTPEQTVKKMKKILQNQQNNNFNPTTQTQGQGNNPKTPGNQFPGKGLT